MDLGKRKPRQQNQQLHLKIILFNRMDISRGKMDNSLWLKSSTSQSYQGCWRRETHIE